MAELISKDIVDLQDIEKIQFIQALKADPAKYAAYVNDKTGRILNETVDMKRATFAKVASDLGRTLDMDHNSAAALYATKQLDDTESSVLTQQKKEESAVKYNMDLTRRQVEINNWYYENKRETLFVLQLLLLTLLMAVIIVALGSNGFLGETAVTYLLTLIIGGAVITWVYRWYYTVYVRDPRYWNRRYFAGDSNTSGAAAPADSECPSTSDDGDLLKEVK